MNKIFITAFDSDKYSPKELFPLVRPFLNQETGRYQSDCETLANCNWQDMNINLVSDPAEADIILISEPLNNSHDSVGYKRLAGINTICRDKNISAYAFVSGDYGKVHPRFSNIIYFRMGGFKSQLDNNNKAFFFLLSNQLKKIFDLDEIVIRQKKEKPTVGFCGHASRSIPKFVYEKLKLAQINLQRFFVADFNFEPLFSSAYERRKILETIGSSEYINSNFIFREKYRAGAQTEQERYKTTLEYYNNILDSDYIVCLRGSGNFSVRLFETLMMGRIPVFINTDCLLPLEDEIDWKKHVVWVEWKDRNKIAKIISDFHKKISEEKFVQMQKDNSEVWASKLTIRNYLKNIINA